MREIITILEDKSRPQDIEIIPLNFTESEVNPVLSKETLDLHYGKLAHGYAERYNNKEGDRDFNYAGVFLHNLLFTQYREVRNSNPPNGPMKGFIDKHYGSYDDMKSEFQKIAMGLQGSNWIYLAHDGSIKTIKNHEVRNDILLLVDWWEHAWILDYGSDKKKYLKEQWKIINWNVINTRWGKSL
jgi:Fe-Mn family superoxide dismutase